MITMKNLWLFDVFFGVAVIISALASVGYAKECTNTVDGRLKSYTMWVKSLALNSETYNYKKESSPYLQDDLTTLESDRPGLASSLPRKVLRDDEEMRWNKRYNHLKYTELGKFEEKFLKELRLQDVRLDPGSVYGKAQQTNLEYLLMLDVDRLMWSFRKVAGLPSPGTPYGGWESPDQELRGHFVGHYLSATAQMWASTGNQSIKDKMTALVSALKECQDKIGTGYLSAFPSEYFTRYENLTYVWAPYYTIHKILAGLLDQHTLAGNRDALKMVERMVEYFYKRVKNVIQKYTIERHYVAMNEETGGMNDVLYRLYRITGNMKHLWLAELFDKPCFLGPLALKAEDISFFHVNTHIPIVIGIQRRYEVTGEELYKEMGTFFMDIVNASFSYVTGGTSNDEWWHYPNRLASELGSLNEESCTTYNMLKVSRNLLRWTRKAEYADYYERAITNGVLSVQRGREPGTMIYFLPLGHGVSKAVSRWGWGTPYGSFWCCYGTGIESFSKLGDSIYFEEGGKVPGLYVIQYVSSSLNWRSGKINLHQIVDEVVSWNKWLRVTIKISAAEDSGTSNLNFRIPSWIQLSSARASMNGKNLVIPAPGNFLSVTGRWKSGDTVAIELPLTLRTEPISDDRPEYASLEAILYGPYVLAGLSTGDFEINIGSAKTVSEWIAPIPHVYNSQLISLARHDGNSKLFVSCQNQSIMMESSPKPGNMSSVSATFRLVSVGSPSLRYSEENVIGKSVMLEPFAYPGMVVAHTDQDQGLSVINPSTNEQKSRFRVVQGLDGNRGTISLESETKAGCFVYGGNAAGQSVMLSCKSDSSDHVRFEKAASFVLDKGFIKYHPMSFSAEGKNRSYLLQPLLSMKDEYYNVYFNITRY
ncbi:hypothetical protein Ancab_001332 [Ancistrocladus abbreviatus]